MPLSSWDVVCFHPSGECGEAEITTPETNTAVKVYKNKLAVQLEDGCYEEDDPDGLIIVSEGKVSMRWLRLLVHIPAENLSFFLVSFLKETPAAKHRFEPQFFGGLVMHFLDEKKNPRGVTAETYEEWLKWVGRIGKDVVITGQAKYFEEWFESVKSATPLRYNQGDAFLHRKLGTGKTFEDFSSPIGAAGPTFFSELVNSSEVEVEYDLPAEYGLVMENKEQ